MPRGRPAAGPGHPERPLSTGNTPSGPTLAPFEAPHAAAVVALIRSVYDEHGMVFDPGFESDLLDIEGHYPGAGGWFRVLLADGRVVGSVGTRPVDRATCEIKRVYLHAGQRGRGHGRRLVQAALDWGAGAGYATAVLWSDVRFATAHAVYRRLGFTVFGERTLDDPDRSHEHGFRITLKR